MAMKKTKTEKIFEPPLIKLTIENNDVFLSVFPQQILFGLNDSCIRQLMNTGIDSETNEMNEFSIEFQLDNASKTKVKLFVNNKHLGLKPFVQNMILGFNKGFIDSLKGIPSNYNNFKLKFIKNNLEIKEIEIY